MLPCPFQTNQPGLPGFNQSVQGGQAKVGGFEPIQGGIHWRMRLSVPPEVTMHWSKLGFVLRHGQCTHRGEGQPYAGENSDLSGDMASVKGGQTKARGFAPTARQQRAVFGSAQRHCWALRGRPAKSHFFRQVIRRGVERGSPSYPFLNQPGAGYGGGWCTGINHDGGHGRRRNAGCLQHHAQRKRTDWNTRFWVGKTPKT